MPPTRRVRVSRGFLAAKRPAPRKVPGAAGDGSRQAWREVGMHLSFLLQLIGLQKLCFEI